MGVEIASKRYTATINSNQKLYEKLAQLQSSIMNLYREYLLELVNPYANNGNRDSIYNLILMNNAEYKAIPPVSASIIAAMASTKSRMLKGKERLTETDGKVQEAFLPIVFEFDDLKVNNGVVTLPNELGTVELPDFLSEIVVPEELRQLEDDEGNSLPVDTNNLEFLTLVQMRFTFYSDKLEMECCYREAIYT